MFRYCIHVLHLSEPEAYLRIAAARAARRHPVLLAMLADGRLHLSGIAKLAPHLTRENRDALLQRATHLSKRQIEELIAEICPRPDVPSLVRKLPGGMGQEPPLPPARLSARGEDRATAGVVHDGVPASRIELDQAMLGASLHSAEGRATTRLAGRSRVASGVPERRRGRSGLLALRRRAARSLPLQGAVHRERAARKTSSSGSRPCCAPSFADGDLGAVIEQGRDREARATRGPTLSPRPAPVNAHTEQDSLAGAAHLPPGVEW